MATVFGASTSRCVVHIRFGNAAPDVPANALLSTLGRKRGWILCSSSRSVVRHRRVPDRQEHRSDSFHHPHLAGQTVEGVIGGVVASTVVVALMLWDWAPTPSTPWCSGHWSRSPHRPATSPNRVIKRAAGAKDFGDAHPRSWWDSRPGSTRRVRGAGPDTVCRRPSSADPGGRGSAAAAGRPHRLDRLDRTSDRRRPGRPSGCVPGRWLSPPGAIARSSQSRLTACGRPDRPRRRR